MWIQRLFLQVFLLTASWQSFAQVSWPTPEVGQMYLNAQEYALAGNYKDAITTYKQAITLAPGVMILYRDLGNALYLSGAYGQAEDVLAPLVKNEHADSICYRLLAQVQAAQYAHKHAVATLHKGLKRFPNSGSLYHELGEIYREENKMEDALNAWLDGVEKAPACASNYYDAALVYLGRAHVLWGVMYGEQYLAMVQDTTGSEEMKRKIFAGYKTFFDNLGGTDVPVYGKEIKQAPADDFEEAVEQIYRTLTPVISDGMTTESLAMVHVRFLMEWFAKYGQKYPFTLFSYQDKLVRSGHFDMYCEWLYGKAESASEYKAWNTFHDGDLERFEQWREMNKYVPSAKDFYNDR